MDKTDEARLSILFDCARAAEVDEVHDLDDGERESLLIGYWEQFPDDPSMVDPIAWHRWVS